MGSDDRLWLYQRERQILTTASKFLAGARFTFLARGMIQPRGEGLCELSIDFTVSEAADQPIEFRIANLQNAFGGTVGFGPCGTIAAGQAACRNPRRTH